MLRHGSRLLAQLALSGLKRILAVFELACGQLEQNLGIGISKLPDEHQLVVIGQRGNRHSARMLHHLAQSLFAVRQLGSVGADVDYPALIDVLFLNCFFIKLHYNKPSVQVLSREKINIIFRG